VGFFNWAAPLVRRFGDRFTPEDAAAVADILRPAVKPGGRLLDVGGGAGQLAALLADALSAHVTVLDPTPEMISHVPPSDHVTPVTGTAEAMPFEDSAFDAIVTTDAFHHFPDQAAAVAEFVRVVRPGGLVLVIDPDPRSLVMRLVARGEKLLGEPGVFLTSQEMCAFMAEHGVEGECTPLRNSEHRFLGRVEKAMTAR
jgi:demethylmenaquinone methyltransferase/2-methoxy-6-polyprenyl-1,4-benzoquinol methylase